MFLIMQEALTMAFFPPLTWGGSEISYLYSAFDTSIVILIMLMLMYILLCKK